MNHDPHACSTPVPALPSLADDPELALAQTQALLHDYIARVHHLPVLQGLVLILHTFLTTLAQTPTDGH